MLLGQKIRDRRLLLGLTQEELANRCELTKGYISQLENDKADPSIITLEQILNALGTTLSDFFKVVSHPQIKFTEEEQLDTMMDGYIQSWLVPTSQNHAMEPIYLVIEPGKKTILDLPHEGEEFGYVLEGEITLHYGDEDINCKCGESFYYKATKKHYIENIGKVNAKVLWVSCPPNF